MKKILLSILVLLLLISITISFRLEGNTCYCNSCEDCNDAYKSVVCKDVALEKGFNEKRTGGVCIDISESKNLDCKAARVFPLDSTFLNINSDNVRISSCEIRTSLNPIEISRNSITLNNIQLISSESLIFRDASNCVLTNLLIQSSKPLILQNMSNCYIKNITIINQEMGVIINNSKNVFIEGLTSSKVNYSLLVYNTTNITLNGLSLSDCVECGTFENSKGLEISTSLINLSNTSLSFSKTSNIRIINLSVVNSTVGLVFSLSTNITITNSSFQADLAIRLINSFGGLVFNNVFNSSSPVYISDLSRFLWNTSYAEERNIIGLKAFGGNIWTNPNEAGFSDTCRDEDYNFICDEPYVINENNQDALPLITYNDRFPPNITFINIPESGSKLLTDKIEFVISSEDESNVTEIYVFFSNPEMNISINQTCFDNPCKIIFTPPVLGGYYINATAVDLVGNVGYSETYYIIFGEGNEIFSYQQLLNIFPLLFTIFFFALNVKLLRDILSFKKRFKK